jgi:hypothetical protein
VGHAAVLLEIGGKDRVHHESGCDLNAQIQKANEMLQFQIILLREICAYMNMATVTRSIGTKQSPTTLRFVRPQKHFEQKGVRFGYLGP